MNISNKIKSTFLTSTSFQHLATQLITLGVQSYTVEVSSGITLFRVERGGRYLLQEEIAIRKVSIYLDIEKVQKAIKKNQLGKSSYTVFMDEIAKAGVRFYEVVLIGDDKRCIYIGLGGTYEEKFY